MAQKVLIIEDDGEIQSLYKDRLTAEGFEVIQETSGNKGFFAAKDNNPDLIILDIMLPGGINGFDVLEKLKKDSRYKRIPVVVLTNLDSEEKVAREIGAVDYVVKANASLDEVVAKVKKYVH